ncbi:MAG: hypothetical protein AAFQ80_16625 [Cyanobacteria bacterium J06621_8]
MANTKSNSIKRSTFFTALAITISIQVIAQSLYPTFDDSATKQNIKVPPSSQVNQ